MILKLKALIYRYTGVYLASKEELEYVDTYDYWKKFKKIWCNEGNDLHMKDIHGILVGSWQCDHGFYSAMYTGKYKVVRPLYRVYKQLSWDLERLFK